MERLLKLYQQWAGTKPASIVKMPGAGSNRQYYRITTEEGNTVVGVVGTSRDENHAFVYLSNHFTSRRLPVPKVLAVSDDELARRLEQFRADTAAAIAKKDAAIRAEAAAL